MLKRLLLRYQGKSIALPAHIGVDDSIYGSLTVYQKEVAEELSDWTDIHGKEALVDIFEEMMKSEADPTCRASLQETMKAIAY